MNPTLEEMEFMLKCSKSERLSRAEYDRYHSLILKYAAWMLERVSKLYDGE